MQDRYTWDVGDFGKYAFLRRVTACQLSLGVLWWRVDPHRVDEAHNGDGNHLAYLNKPHAPSFRKMDGELFDASLEHVRAGKRSVEAVQQSGLLGGARYHSTPMNFRSPGDRDKWLSDGIEAAGSPDVVFLDPDNGFEVSSVGYRSARAVKYVYRREVRKVREALPDSALIVYQHGRRDQTAPNMFKQIATDLRGEGCLPDGLAPFAVSWSAWNLRMFVVIPGQNTAVNEALTSTAAGLVGGNLYNDRFGTYRL